ncbi:MAG: class I SAM-dependent methyltransferase [Gemmobacter sp.]
MHLDVHDLREFYYRTRLGRAAQKAIRARIAALAPPRAGEVVAGFGFAVPLLRPYLEADARVIALMPAPQGVMPWPAGQANVAALCDEAHWPLLPASVDRLILMHGLETSERPSALLDEAFRVLAPGGSVIFVVPNRAGLWARRDGTPFGYGRPYSAGQLEAQMKRHAFTPERAISALYVPPVEARFWLRTADFWERTGRTILPWRAGGVLIVEGTKELHAPTRGTAAAVQRPMRVLEGAARPVAEPG